MDACAKSDKSLRNDCPIRPATEEEEAWLQWEEQLFHHLQLEGTAITSRTDAQDAEAFDIHEARTLWMQAEAEVSVREEAEFIYRVEEQHEEQLIELANVKNIKRHLMMESLKEGSKFLVDEKAAEEANYQVLVSVHKAANKLAQIVGRTIQLKMDEERVGALQKCAKLALQQRESEATAAQERAQLKAEISRLKRDFRDLNEKFEREKDKTTCRICFVKPRDVLPLPCMHFHYCNTCLLQYQRSRNICPTCRSPISGVLKYNLSIG